MGISVFFDCYGWLLHCILGVAQDVVIDLKQSGQTCIKSLYSNELIAIIYNYLRSKDKNKSM